MAVVRYRNRIKRREKSSRKARKFLTRKRGRSEYISDSDLLASRDRLASLAESTWCNIGWPLESLRYGSPDKDFPVARQITELRTALCPWDHEPYREDMPVKMLLRSHREKQAATATQLFAMKRRLLKLNDDIRNAGDQHGLRTLADQAKTTLLQKKLQKDSRQTLKSETVNLNRVIRQMTKQQPSLVKEQRKLHEKLFDSYAYFAQLEFLDFLQQHRNRLNPLRLANALAGLPFIGWRQSAKRCTKWKCDVEKGFRYRLFKFIRRVVTSRAWGTELVDLMEKFIHTKRSIDPYVTSLLDWPVLRGAMTAVLASEESGDRDARAYRIGAEYLRRISNPSPADRLVADIQLALRDKM